MYTQRDTNLTETSERLRASTVQLQVQIQESHKYVCEIKDLMKSSQRNGSLQLEALVEKLQKIYVYLEHIATQEAACFSDSGKANLRRAQGELQKIRLSLFPANNG